MKMSLLRRTHGPEHGPATATGTAEPAPGPADGAVPIASLTYRTRARVAGRVRSMRIQPWAGVATLECTVVDATGGIVIVFLGRRHVAGLQCGSQLVAEGMVGESGGRLALLNPEYWLLAE